MYVLQSSTSQLYVGISKDLDRRIKEHHRRQSPSVKRLEGDLIEIYREEFASYAQARKREVYLKSGAGRAWLRQRQGVPRPEPCQGLGRSTA
ncbi:MAG: GIY-YIG nuclease family protein [Verrucomicrobia bacterium]|nr:GIY-YIG nuclease family protein [Verrucomicrobiota bacterium]